MNGANAIRERDGRLRQRSSAVPSPFAMRVGNEVTSVARRSVIWESGTILAYSLPALLTLVAVLQWFRPGKYVASGDVGPFIHDSIIEEMWSLWGHHITGAGSPTYAVATASEIFLANAAGAIGLGAQTAQQWFYALIAVGVVLSATYFCRSLEAARPAAALGGLFAFFNPYVLQSMPNALPLWAMMLMGISGGLLIRAARGTHVSAMSLGFVSLLAGYLAFNPPLLLVLILWVLLLTTMGSFIGGRRSLERSLSLLVCSMPACLLLSLWWIVPFGFTLMSEGTGPTLQAQTDVTEWAWTHVRNSIPNILSLSSTWAWRFPEYFPYAHDLDRPPWGVLKFGIPFLALIAPVANSRARRATLPLALTALVLLALAKGLHSPLASLNLFLYDHVPGMWLFREPASKLAPMLVLLYSILSAVTVATAFTWARQSRRLLARAALGASLGIVLGGLVYPYPLWTGEVIPAERGPLPSAHVRVPPEWHRTARFLNNEPGHGKALLLPLNDYYQVPTTWGYYGADTIPARLLRRPTIGLLPEAYLGQTQAFASIVKSVEDTLAAGSTYGVPKLLRSLGISHVIVRKDIRRTFADRQFQIPGALDESLRKTPRLHLRYRNPLANVYEIEGTENGLIDIAKSGLVHSSEDIRVLPNLVKSAPSGSVIVSSSDEPEASNGQIVSLGSRVVSFRTSGEAEVARIGSTSSHLALITVTRNGSSIALRIRPAVRLLLDDRPLMPFRPALLRIHAAGSIIVGDHFLKPRERSVMLSVRSRESLKFYRNPTSTSGLRFSPAGDCNAFDNRSMAEVGIRAQRLFDQPQPAIRLQAREHVACVSAPIRPFTGGTEYRLQFEYRTVNGRAARFCLWQEGPDRCADLPALEASSSWQRYDSTYTPDAGITGLSLFLYADGGGSEKSTTDYRAVRFRPWEEVATWTPAARAPESLPLTAGLHELRRTDLRPPRHLRFSPAGDCNAFDNRSMAEVGIRAQRLFDQPQPAIRLQAREHVACVSAPIRPFTGGTEYRLQFEYRTVNGRAARFCLWQEGPDRCADLPALEASSSWQRYDSTYTPDAGTTGLSLFLYADGGGSEKSTTDYRALRFSYEPPYTLLIAPQDDGEGAPDVSWRRSSPTAYQVDLGGSPDPFLLVLRETFASGWGLQGVPAARSVQHLIVDGYANGWLISPGEKMSVVIAFKPQRVARGAQLVSALTITLMPFTLFRQIRLTVRRTLRLLARRALRLLRVVAHG